MAVVAIGRVDGRRVGSGLRLLKNLIALPFRPARGGMEKIGRWPTEAHHLGERSREAIRGAGEGERRCPGVSANPRDPADDGARKDHGRRDV